jgi:type II secretory pathway component PulF
MEHHAFFTRVHDPAVQEFPVFRDCLLFVGETLKEVQDFLVVLLRGIVVGESLLLRRRRKSSPFRP